MSSLLSADLLVTVAATSGRISDGPAPEDVKAGWTAFVVFLLLAAAVAVLCVSLVRRLRKVQAAKDAGLYGDEPVEPGSSDRSE